MQFVYFLEADKMPQMKNIYRTATFLISVAHTRQLPTDEGFEVAFVGRSNAGKSSALNALTEQKALARTSKTPGRTQLINFFTLADERRLVDLPGYGYAKAPLAAQQQWSRLINSYITARQSLKGIVLLMDIRHPFTPFDLQLIDWTATQGIALHILLSKADKLAFGNQKITLLKAQQTLKQYSHISIQLFSSLKKTGLDELQQQLNSWLYTPRT